ncbi:MAG: hypothetical protein WD876_03340, partial [Candidatus Pacearchaeota archaeon]
GLDNTLIAAMKDGSYVSLPMNRVICYDFRERGASSGVGVSAGEFVDQLQKFGNVHLVNPRNFDHRKVYEKINASDIVEVYTINTFFGNSNEPIVAPKKGLSRILWRLSML